MGQIVVEGLEEYPFSMGGAGIESHDLSLGMNAGVRAACSLDAQALAGEAMYNLLQRLLNGHGVALGLKAVVCAAVVLDQHGKPT